MASLKVACYQRQARNLSSRRRFQVYDAHQRAYILWDNPRRLELLEWAIQKAEAGPPDLSYIEVSEYNENEFRHKGDDFWRLDHPIYHDDGRLWV